MNWLHLLQPEEGLWRPELMFCDQVTSVIYTNLSHREIAGAFRIADLQQALLNAPRKATRSQAFVTIPEAVKEYHAVLNHELDHLRRQFSTSCGFLQLHLRSQLIWACQQLFIEWQACDDALPFPLVRRRFLTEEWLNWTLSDPRQLSQRWMEQDAQKRTVLTAIATSECIRGIDQGAALTKRVLTDAALLRASGSGTFAPIGFAHPHIEPEIDEWLGAQHLYEHMVVLQQLFWRTHLGGRFDEWRRFIECDARYRKILELWHQFFPQGIFLDSGTMRPTDVITDVYRMYPVEFYAVLDLALWIPFTPKGFRTTRRPIRWEDVQPGHRFLRGLSALRESRRPLMSITSDDRESRFIETQRWIADEMGWEPVENLAAEWRMYLQSERWYDEQLFAGYRENSVVQVARAVLERRQAHPFDVVCNNASWHENPVTRFAIWMTNEGDAGCQMHSLGDEEMGTITRYSYYLFHGCETFLFDKKGYLLRLDESLRREALNIVTQALRCNGWNEELFREMAASSLNL